MSLFIKRLLFGLLLAGGLCAGAYAGSTVNPDSILAGDPVIGGISINSVSPLEAGDLYKKDLTGREIVIKGTDTVDTIQTKDVLLNSDSEDLLSTIVRHKILGGMEGYYRDLQTSLASQVPLRFDEEKLNAAVSELSCVSGSEVVQPKDAAVIWDGWEAEIIPEVVGNAPDTEKLEDKIRELTAAGNGGTISLTSDDLYKKPAVTEDSPVIERGVTNLENASEAVITYEFGDWPETLTVYEFGDWLSTDSEGNVVVDRTELETYLRKFSDWYNVFENKQEAIALKPTLTGYLIDYGQETEACAEAIAAGRSEDRTLESFTITSQDVATVVTDENQALIESVKARAGDTFVYISIDKQFMWFYKNGQQIAATPVVTGTEYAYDTPRGEYELYYKSTNVTLKGANYESHVNFWMPFNGDIGIHDASWRSSYGGDIYEYSGSHGCINTPYAQAEAIYDNIEAGTKIIVE